MSSNVEIQQLQEAPFPKVEIPSTFDLGMLKTIAAGQLITVKAKVTTLRTPALLQTGNDPLNTLEGQIVDAKGYSKIIFQEDYCKQVEEGKTYIFENIRVKKDKFTKQLYINTAKTHTVIRPTEPHTEVLAFAPRLTDDYPTTTVTGSVAGVTAPSIYVACVKCNKKIGNEDNSDIITCNNCNMQQMKEFCPAQYYAQVFFLTKPKNEKLSLTLFDKVITQLFSTNAMTDVTKVELVKLLLSFRHSGDI